MRAAQISPAKIRNIIEGVRAAGREVDSLEIDGIVINLANYGTESEESPSGLGKIQWSKS